MSELTYLPIFRSVLRHLLGVGGTRMAGATRTYGAIMTLVDSDDDSFVIPYERIAERAGLSKQIVTRHMTYLTISGWLTRVGRFGRTKNTKYRLTLTRRTCQELARLENPLGRLQEIAQYNEVLSAILTAAEQKYVLDTLDDWKFFRFPLVHRDKIGALSHCAVLSLIYWRCGERDTGVLADESRHGAPYVTHMLGLTYDQASGALTALSIGAAPVISYDSAKYIVRIQSVNIDGQESDQSISTTQTVPTMPTTPSIPIVGVATILSDVGMFCDSNVDGVGSVIHEVGSVIHEVGSVIADGRVCDSDKSLKNLKADQSLPNHAADGSILWCSIQEKSGKSPEDFVQFFVSQITQFRNLHQECSDLQEIIIAVAIGAECGEPVLLDSRIDDPKLRFCRLRQIADNIGKSANDRAGVLCAQLKKITNSQETAFCAMRKYRNAAKEIQPKLISRLNEEYDRQNPKCSYCGQRVQTEVNGFTQKRVCVSCDTVYGRAKYPDVNTDWCAARDAARRMLGVPYERSDDDEMIDECLRDGTLTLSPKTLEDVRKERHDLSVERQRSDRDEYLRTSRMSASVN